MVQRRVTVASPVGLHARPAAAFVRAARDSAVEVRIARDGKEPVPASSLVSVLSLAVGQGEDVTLSADGDGAETVLDQLATLLARADV